MTSASLRIKVNLIRICVVFITIILFHVSILGEECLIPTDGVHVDTKMISMYSLAANGHKYDKLSVSFQGVVAVLADGGIYMFVNKDALENLSFHDAVKLNLSNKQYVHVFQKILENTGIHYDIIGSYSHQGYKINGWLHNISHLCKSASLSESERANDPQLKQSRYIRLKQKQKLMEFLVQHSELSDFNVEKALGVSWNPTAKAVAFCTEEVKNKCYIIDESNVIDVSQVQQTNIGKLGLGNKKIDRIVSVPDGWKAINNAQYFIWIKTIVWVGEERIELREPIAIRDGTYSVR